MKTVRIIRYANRVTHTLGLMYLRDDKLPFKLKFQMYTLELPDKGNERNISRIPEGEYNVVTWLSPKHGECYKILDVPDRGDILIHVGNWVEDTEGCILVGLGQSSDMIAHSVSALCKLDRLIGDDTIFKLIIGSL